MLENAVMSRRNLLRGLAAGGSAMGLAATGIAMAAEEDDGVWDEEHELVVVGAGGSLVGAMAAQHEGHDVVVFEKRGTYGGTTFMSAGAIWAPCNNLMSEGDAAEESEDKAVEFLSNADEGHVHSEADLRSWVSKVPALYDYMIDELDMPIVAGDFAPLDYCNYEGTGRGRTIWIADSEGAVCKYGCWGQTVEPVVDAAGLDIRLSTPVVGLVQDGSGAVTGVVARDADGNTVRCRATKAVLLATGPFDHNEKMRRKYLWPDLMGSSVPVECTGDGHALGVAAGGELANMNNVYGTLSCAVDLSDEDAADPSLKAKGIGWTALPAGVIAVNKSGHRFMNESSGYDEKARALCNMDFDAPSRPDFLSGNSIAIYDGKAVERYGLPGWAEDYPQSCPSFDSLEELADAMGIDAEGLAAEVERYNGFCETGIDEDFHRGQTTFDDPELGVGTHDLAAFPRPDLANMYLDTIDTPPFHAVVIGRGSIGTAGGLVVDEDCRVLDADGEPITGLYASGCVADALVNGLPGCGFCVSMTLSRGLIAVDHALGLGICE